MIPANQTRLQQMHRRGAQHSTAVCYDRQARQRTGGAVRRVEAGASVQVRTALEVHAKQLGTSLVDLVRNVATAGQETFRSAATFSASQRFTPSRHASLIRIAGDISAGDSHVAAAAAAVAHVDGAGPGSPASVSSAEAVPVAVFEPTADGGDAPTMQVQVCCLTTICPLVLLCRVACCACGPVPLAAVKCAWQSALPVTHPRRVAIQVSLV